MSTQEPTGTEDASDRVDDGSADKADTNADAVEQAGETTAAAATGGNAADERPVGADTLVEVEGDPKPRSAKD